MKRILAGILGLGLAGAAVPALAAWGQPPSGGSYVNPDGSYPSYEAFSRDLNGTPCGIACTHQLAVDRYAEYHAMHRYPRAWP